ncbi:hypothetical protein EFY79_19725 [Hanamia caeni]|uniref:Uncharacterized protein n=1 Tax=Hanamia caeni TaxID=2294116 RepID=A0A3M9N6J4_9BACT|nr:hypothetical protein [Hanamia caeni]RNI32823.1 hypothetical protein EFY79_19725 [Hanamia caeni]
MNNYFLWGTFSLKKMGLFSKEPSFLMKEVKIKKSKIEGFCRRPCKIYGADEGFFKKFLGQTRGRHYVNTGGM